MKKVWLMVGKAAFWLSLPALWVYLRQGTRVRVLIICGDEFLVVRQWLSSGNWILPGGGLHKNENPLHGLVREVREETGIKLAEQDVKFLYNTRHSDRGISFTYDCFEVVLDTKPEITLQKYEIADYAWTALENPTVRLSKDAQYALGQWQNKP